MSLNSEWLSSVFFREKWPVKDFRIRSLSKTSVEKSEETFWNKQYFAPQRTKLTSAPSILVSWCRTVLYSHKTCFCWSKKNRSRQGSNPDFLHIDYNEVILGNSVRYCSFILHLLSNRVYIRDILYDEKTHKTSNTRFLAISRSIELPLTRRHC